MKNTSCISNLNSFKTSVIHKFVLKFLIFCSIFTYTGKSHAQEPFSVEQSEMEDRSLEERIATKEPKFFDSRTSAHWIGFYFGVGFRRVRLQVVDIGIISDSDGTANGIGFNLGYILDEQVLEYERQVSIVEHPETFTDQDSSGQKIDIIQNNFWYIQYPKINHEFYLHYGAGLQFTKTRFAGTASNHDYEDEIALGIETGASYFVTSNLLIYYRFSIGQHLPFLNASASNPFLKQSQLHTIYLNYFFSL